MRRPSLRAALLFVGAVLLLGACEDDGGAPVATTTLPAGEATATPVQTAEPPDDLGSAIGPRADLPVNDPIALAARYGVTDGPAPASKPFAGEPAVGSTREFSAILFGPSMTPSVARVNATLMATSQHAYFYVDTAIGASATDAQNAADTFEAETWPTITGVFGAPRGSGVDGDPRIVVLQTDVRGLGGYHNADDLFLRSVRPLSNEAEMVYIDDSYGIGGAGFDVVLAHELQHLIHDSNDFGEEVWVNEGLSIVAEGLAGGALSVVDEFEEAPSTQLNRWDFANSAPHYGASGAFLRYVADRFGGDAAIGAIARAEGDGPAGIDEFLAEHGDGLPFRSAFADWLAANALNRADGAYANPSRSIDLFIGHSLAAGDTVESAANQFGADYYELSGLTGGEYVLRFQGESDVEVLPLARDGDLFWSNTGDAINTAMTLEINVPAASPTLSFRAWYDIERWFDRGYVAVSTDAGETWRALTSTSTTTDDPVRVALGPGFDGRSGGGSEPRWVDETVDLGEFAGRTVLLRFEIVTDGGTHGEGWAVRDIELHDGDTSQQLDDRRWAFDGWLRIDRALPQTYVVRLIGERADGEAVVLDVPLDQDQDGELRFDTDGVTGLLLAIAGTTEGTNVRAPYSIMLERP
jgi:hypothetical protein